MTWLLLGGIRLYWILRPIQCRRCVFKESCSRHVYRVTESFGLGAGVGALYSRYRQCRPGYVVCASADGLCLRLADGSYLLEDYANPEVFGGFTDLPSRRELQLNNLPDALTEPVGHS